MSSHVHKYGNKWDDIGTRVAVTVEAWFLYTEEIRDDTYEVHKRMRTWPATFGAFLFPGEYGRAALQECLEALPLVLCVKQFPPQGVFKIQALT